MWASGPPSGKTFPLFRNLFGNSEFSIVDIKYRFTCANLNFHENKLYYKDIMSLIVGEPVRNDIIQNLCPKIISYFAELSEGTV